MGGGGPVRSMQAPGRRPLRAVATAVGVVVAVILAAAAPVAAVSDTTKPSTPQNLRSTGTTVTTIAIAWNASTDNVGVTGYRIYQDGGLIASVSATSYTVS